MDRERAKLILSASRADGTDTADPEIAAALVEAEQDPELKRWLERERQLDTLIGRKLNEPPPPPDLLDTILAGSRVSQRKPLWRRWHALPLAAAMVLMLALGYFWSQRYQPGDSVTREGFYQDMAAFLDSYFRLDFVAEEIRPVNDWLSQRPALATVAFPNALKNFSEAGCRSINWHEREVALICFKVQDEWVHVFVLPGNDLPDAPVHSQPVLATVGKWSTASWSGDKLTYFVTTRGDRQFLASALGMKS